MTQTPSLAYRSENKLPLALLGAGLLCTAWAFWTTLVHTAHRWASDPLYSHGYLVPFFAGALLWLRRHKLAGVTLRPSWWGVPVLLAAFLLRMDGAYRYREFEDAVSLVPFLAGLVLTVGGKRALDWAWPALAFLLFMIPLPYRLSVAMTGPLQTVATLCSTFLLQTLALPAIAEGNVIHLNDVEINVVEACSGLRMLVIFFALATALVLVIRRPLWQKLTLVASAAPIALVVNVLRITVTGIMFETVGDEAAKAVFHDLAGWLMMPVALGFLWLELKLLSNLIIEPPAGNPALVPPRPAAAAPGRSARPPRRQKWQPARAQARPGSLS